LREIHDLAAFTGDIAGRAGVERGAQQAHKD
jgi:hypothetical protein